LKTGGTIEPTAPGAAAPGSATVVAAAVGAATIATAAAASGQPTLALAALVALVGGGAMLVYPALALAVLVSVAYANLPSIAAERHDLTALGEILVPAMLAVVALRYLARGEIARDLPKLTLLLAVYVTSIAATALWAHDVPRAFEQVVVTLKNAVIALAVIGLVTHFDRFRVAAITLVATAGVLAGLSVLQYTTGSFHADWGGLANATLNHIADKRDSWRLSGPLSDANFYAMILLLALPLAVDRALHGGAAWWRLVAAAVALVIALAVVLTYSRGALVALAVMAVVAGWSLRARLVPVLVLAALVAFTATQLLSAQYGTRIVQAVADVRTMVEGTGYTEDPAVAGRVAEMRAALAMFRDNPLLGVGFDQAEILYQDTAMMEGLMARGSDRQAHSLYLEVLAERGLLGSALFAGLLAFALWSTSSAARLLAAAGRRSEALLARAYATGLIGFLTASIFLHDGYPRYFWLALALALALPQAAAAHLRKVS
jgi:O-antigen ligase